MDALKRAAEIRDTLIEGAKLDARNSMRSDPHVWHEALETALDQVLPAFWDAAHAWALRDARQALIEDQMKRYGIVLPDVHEILDQLDEQADRIDMRGV